MMKAVKHYVQCITEFCYSFHKNFGLMEGIIEDNDLTEITIRNKSLMSHGILSCFLCLDTFIQTCGILREFRKASKTGSARRVFLAF